MYKLLLCCILLVVICSGRSVWEYNVVWTTPSTDVSGSMPIGNGRVAANVWVEPQNSKVSLYVSRTDSWDENANLLKLTKVDLIFSPPIDRSRFNQTLDMDTATVMIQLTDLSVRVWIDANSDNIFVETHSTKAYNLKVVNQPWRLSTTPVPGAFQSWYCEKRYIYPDVVLNSVPSGLPPNSLVFYHRNQKSDFFTYSLNIQGLGSAESKIPDPLTNRQFGGAIYGPGLTRSNSTELSSNQAQTAFTVAISTLTRITNTPQDWQTLLGTQVSRVPINNLSQVRASHEAWWKAFWERSWIFITSSKDQNNAFLVSRQYTIWRFVQALNARSEFMLKFNGLTFVAQAGVNPDYRDWGGGNWWQNLRLSYYNMLNAGDFDLMHSLFEYYLNMLPAALSRTVIYWNFTGAYWPETQTIFGLSNNAGGYGCPGSRNNLPVNIAQSVWNRYNYQGCLDLSLLILDHYAYTTDDAVLSRYFPIVQAALEFYSRRWTKLDNNGKLILFPSQALETWQCQTYPPVESDCVTNDLPDIAGLNAVLSRVLQLPAKYVSPQFKELCNTLLNRLPPIPTGGNGAYLVPGEKLPAKTTNSENTELYAVHPYRLYTYSKPNKQIAINSYNRRMFKCNQGWCQDIMDAALLGLTEEAQSQVIQRAQTQPAQGYRFPGFMPHFQDYEPSLDHLSNMNNALQWMLLQPADNANEDIILFPAWPCSDWDVDFRLNGPRNTTVTASYKSGKLQSYTVNPSSRTSAVKFAQCA